MGRIQRKINACGVSVCLWCLFLIFTGQTEAFAAVTEGRPGETVSGEYAVIVNTSTVSGESTGTLVFDNNGSSVSSAQTARAADGAGQDLIAEQGGRAAAAAVSSYAIGTEKMIGSSGSPYVCIGEGDHCYIWMDKTLKQSYDKAGKTAAIAADMAKTYDGVPYQTLCTMAGGAIPCQDNTGKLSVLLEILSGASGVYRGESGITAIHVNAPDAAGYQPGVMESRNGLLVHEGQHALFHLMTNYTSYRPDPADYAYLWLNEGLAVAAMDYIWGGTDNSGWLDGIAGNADIRNGSSLVYGSYRDSAARDYGMPYLFIRYLIAQETGGYNPMELFPRFYTVSADCAPAAYMEKVMGGTGFSDLLTDFYTAVIAQEPDGRYGFAGDPVVYEKVKDYPLYMGDSQEAHMLPATGAIAIRLQNGAFTVPKDGGPHIRYMIVGEGQRVSAPASGNGTGRDPYQITSFRELNLIGNQPDAHYRLEADIQSEGKLNLTITDFRGVLDGNGHTIHGLRQPLTGRNSGTIRNLTIRADLAGEYADTQGIFTQLNEGIIAECTAEGRVSVRMLRSQSNYAETAFGGIAGINNVAGKIRGCTFSAAVSVQLPAVKCRVGGIAGIQQGTVEKCCSQGDLAVTQPDGLEHKGYVPGSGDSYDAYVGGIAGELRKQANMGGTLSGCIHTGSISVQGGNQAVGQLCGLVNDNIINSAWGVSAHVDGCYARQGSIPAVGYPGGAISEEEILLSDEALKDSNSYAGWDFVGEWKMGDDGPVRIGADDIQDIRVDGNPTECYVGERIFSWGRLQVNGGSGIKITDDMVSGFDSSVPGTILVTVSYMGKNTSFSMDIREPGSVSDLEAVFLASQTGRTYYIGEYFDPGTVYLRATIDGRSGKMIYSGFDYDKKAPLTLADTSVLLSYYGGSVACPVTVKEKEVTGITITSKMGKTQYQEGQRLDLSEVRVQLTYSGGEKTDLLSSGQFEAYGIHVARCSGDSVSVMERNAVLRTSDQGASVYLYVGDTLPGTYGTIAAMAGKLTVWEQMKVPDGTLHLLTGKQSWLYTESVTGGSGKYQTQKVDESLPPGITRMMLPDNSCTYFYYTGTTTAPAGSVFSLSYRVTDTLTGVSADVVVKIQVHDSDEAAFFQFDLLKNLNPGLKRDVTGIIKESAIILRVPVGTDVSDLEPTIEFGYNMGVELPQQFWNGTRHDFTEPVVYTLTAPDGKTKRSYTVSVEFVSESEQPGGNEGDGAEQPGGDASSGSGTGNTGGNTVSGGGTEQPGGDPSSGGGTEQPGGDPPSGGGTGNTGGNPSSGGGAVSTDGSTAASGGNDSSDSESLPSSASQTVYPSVGRVVRSGAAYYRITASGAGTKNVEVKGLVKKKTTSLKIPASVKIDGYTYRVTAIGRKAFQNNRYLKKIIIGKNVTSVGANACKGCKKLVSVTLPSGLRKIGDNAFNGCTGLKKAVAGKSLQTIGKNAFQNCKNLRTLTLKGQKVRSVGKNAIKGIYKKAVIRVPKKSLKTYQKLFTKKTGYVKSIKIKK